MLANENYMLHCSVTSLYKDGVRGLRSARDGHDDPPLANVDPSSVC
jgi:hypothetical protein